MKLFNRSNFLSLFIFLSFGFNAQTEGFEVLKNLELIDLIHQHLDMYYVDEPQTGRLSKVGIEAMLKDLDPYTVYYHEANMEEYRLMTTGQYGGIGALIRKVGDYITIDLPYKDNPAQKAGLKSGDRILSIDGKNMVGKKSDEVSENLKGPKGSTIAVKVLRGTEEKTINITRDEIKLPDVPYTGMIKPTVGYIRLNSFTQTASDDVKKAFADLKSKGMTELVFDLRGNGGGLLIEAVKIVNMFVKRDQLVVSCKARIKEENRVYKTTEEPLDLNIPLIILVDEGSASASEIVAGTLQDLDRAVIIGQTSFGKGLVQRTYDLKYGSKMKLTIAKYYTPSGRCVQRLEYYDKEKGMQAKSIPDSLVKKFKTLNGRTVNDARGIEPDFVVEVPDYNRITGAVLFENIIFNWANNYANSHPTIADAKTFHLTDAEYLEFTKYTLAQKFEYTTASQEALQDMLKISEKEGYDKDTKKEYEALLLKVTPSKEIELAKHKEEILRILENEIVGKYYYTDGKSEHAFGFDLELKKAFEILSDKKLYKSTLIGK
jgi:carboxyl-terminal processing protease